MLGFMLAGRVSVFAEPTEETRAQGKKGGEWVYVSHDLADANALISAVQARLVTGASWPLQHLLLAPILLLSQPVNDLCYYITIRTSGDC
jgi:tRNA(Phe) wybutosine-synthesizing methylase Tyw3